MTVHDSAIRILNAELARLEAADRPEVAEAFREAIDVLEQNNQPNPNYVVAHNHLIKRLREGLKRLAEISSLSDFRHRREAYYYHVLAKIAGLPNYSTADQMREMAQVALIADELGRRKFGRSKTRPWRGERSRAKAHMMREAEGTSAL